ncbi:MAG: CPBP family intramembrane glutamic endopeptidase [Terracidiphilus sp.]
MNDFEPTPCEPWRDPASPPDSDPPPCEQPGDGPADLFASWQGPEQMHPRRIPHFGHLCLLMTLALIGLMCAVALILIALHFHLFGVTSTTRAATDIHYILGEEAVLYLVTLALSLAVFPLFWNKSFFAGIQWHGTTAFRLRWRLFAIAAGCFGLAALDEMLLPGPANAPIEEIFRSPSAAWLMFGFGVTLAPLFEEIAFRGFLLPALATACDWTAERFAHTPPRPLTDDGDPQWSLAAMAIASVATSLPFALLHGEQTGHALGPLILLIVISLILCAVRLKTRSLAASALVHASYNFLLFSLMMIGTGGFQHLGKM